MGVIKKMGKMAKQTMRDVTKRTSKATTDMSKAVIDAGRTTMVSPLVSASKQVKVASATAMQKHKESKVVKDSEKFAKAKGDKILDFLNKNYETYGELIDLGALEQRLVVDAIFNDSKLFEKCAQNKYVDMDKLLDMAIEYCDGDIHRLPRLFNQSYFRNNKEKIEELVMKSGRLETFQYFVENFEPKNPEKLVARIKEIQSVQQKAKDNKKAVLDALEIPEIVKESNVKKVKEEEIPEIIQAGKIAKSNVFDIDSEFGK